MRLNPVVRRRRKEGGGRFRILSFITFLSVQDNQGLIVKSKKSVSEAGIKDKDQLYLSTLGKHRDQFIY